MEKVPRILENLWVPALDCAHSCFAYLGLAVRDINEKKIYEPLTKRCLRFSALFGCYATQIGR